MLKGTLDGANPADAKEEFLEVRPRNQFCHKSIEIEV